MAVEVKRGSCLCGAVAFEVTPPLRDVVACHCTQCRKQSGHYWAATSVPLDRFRLTSDAGLAWFSITDTARRGFCKGCGAFLFWEPVGEGRISFAPGAIDGPTGIGTISHIYPEAAGDYYSPEGPPPAPQPAPDALTGSCLCGANQFRVDHAMGPVTACHCNQCRKLSGHFAASFDVREGAFHWTRQTRLAEFTTPGGGQRGFCTGCGSSLYFRAADGALSVECGAIDNPTGGWLTEHIFTGHKGDYYQIDDGLPQVP